MLFRTVYGPELEAIHRYVGACNCEGLAPDRSMVRDAFMPRYPAGDTPSTQGVDDAVAFLESAHLLYRQEGYRIHDTGLSSPFCIRLLAGLRQLEQGTLKPVSPLDPLYMQLLTELFINPDQLFIADVHAAANQLLAVQAAGGVSKEKIRAWERVMTFLGTGQRIQGGFQCVFSPEIVGVILGEWDKSRGALQDFFVDCFDKVLPHARADGELSRAASLPFEYLQAQGSVTLYPMQDSPTRAYFGSRRYKGIATGGRDD